MKFRIMILAILFCTISAESWAQGVVREIEIKGEQRIPEETIRAQLGVKPGSMFDRERISKDIHKLFEMGAFQDIQVFEELTSSGLRLIYRIVEKPIIAKISFKGNKKIKSKDLEEKIKIDLHQPFDEKKLVESLDAIREAYEKKNFYLMKVDHYFQPLPDGDTELVLEVREHAPTFIRQVQFVGNRVFTDKELRKLIQTKKKGPFSFLSGSGKYKDEQLQQDVMRLTFHYLKHGYVKVKVEPADVYLTKDRRFFFVSFKIQEGDRYHISDIDVSGDILTTREEFLKHFQTKPKTIYNRELIEKDVQALVFRYGDLGYAFAHIQPLMDMDDVKKEVKLDFHIEKGERIRIEKIVIEGNTVTRDKVIRRELKIKEGDIYSESRLNESRGKIQALGYFKEVNFATPRGLRDDTVILKISVEEQPTGSFNIGAGFSTAESFIFSASIQKNNFFGFGISGQASFEFSNIRQQFLVSMTDPYFLDTEWILSLSGYRSIYSYNDFDRYSYGGSGSIGHRIFDNSSITLGYDVEQVSITDFSVAVPQMFRNNAGGLTSNVNLTVARDTRDNRIYAKKGTFYSGKVEYSGGGTGADNDFLRYSGRSQFYQPILWGITFRTFGRVGYVDSLNSAPVPLFERFFLGGVNSLRGYFPQSIGPKLRIPTSSVAGDTDFVYGGNKMWIANAELEFPIVEAAGLKFVSFYDVGNAFAEEENFSITKARQDYGFGIRWISPMGPLRFEWGIPINPKAGEDDLIFNFTIGQFF